MTPFKKATKRAVKLRAAIDGPTGAGKTLSALKIARGLAGPNGTIAVIDTEHGTAEKFYAREVEFDAAELTKYQPKDYVQLINQAKDYDVLVIDSLSHAWEGVLSMVDAKGGQFGAWRDVTPHHQALVNALLTFPGHLIVTMRTKMAYEVSTNDKGRTEVVKLGLKPVQREGLEYEFDLVMDIDQAHRLTVSKSRIKDLADRTELMPTEEFGVEIARLLSDGEPMPEPTAADRIKADPASVVAILRGEYPDATAEMDDDEIKQKVRGQGYDTLQKIEDGASNLLRTFPVFLGDATPDHAVVMDAAPKPGKAANVMDAAPDEAGDLTTAVQETFDATQEAAA